MDTKEYFNRVIKKIENMGDEEFLDLLKKSGIDDCPLREQIFCSECRKDVEYQIKNLVEEKKVRGLEFEYTAERAYCNKCGSEIFISELHDKNLKKIDNAYREKQGL